MGSARALVRYRVARLPGASVSDLLVNLAAAIAGSALLGTVGAVYTVLAWHCRRRLGTLALLVLWLTAALAVGYLGYYRTCHLGLTCDVGGVDYRALLVPRFACIGALGFGVATAVVERHARRARSGPLGRRRALISALGVVIGFFLAVQLINGIHRLTCATRPFRRVNDTWGTKCDVPRP